MERVYFITSNMDKINYTIKFHGFRPTNGISHGDTPECEEKKRTRFMDEFPNFKPVTKGAFLYKQPRTEDNGSPPVKILLAIVKFLRRLEEEFQILFEQQSESTSTSDTSENESNSSTPSPPPKNEKVKVKAVWNSEFSPCKEDDPCSGCIGRNWNDSREACDRILMTIVVQL